MDKTQFVTIAVTAMITAFSREIAGAFSSKVKNLATNTTVREKIRTALTANRIAAIINLLLLSYCIWRLYVHVNSSAPLDRFAVFDIAYFTSLAALSFARIDTYIMLGNERRKQERILAEQLQLELAEKEAAEEKRFRESMDKLKEVVDRSERTLSERTKNPDDVQ